MITIQLSHWYMKAAWTMEPASRTVVACAWLFIYDNQISDYACDGPDFNEAVKGGIVFG